MEGGELVVVIKLSMETAGDPGTCGCSGGGGSWEGGGGPDTTTASRPVVRNEETPPILTRVFGRFRQETDIAKYSYVSPDFSLGVKLPTTLTSCCLMSTRTVIDTRKLFAPCLAISSQLRMCVEWREDLSALGQIRDVYG